MAIIIGAGTNVSITNGGSPVSDGIQSVNWQVQVQTNRLWSIGQWTPYKSQISKTLSVSVSAYAGVLGTIAAPDLGPSTGCLDSAASMAVFIDPATCTVGEAVVGIDDTLFVTSYSYSKGDPTAFASESWSFQKWVDAAPDGFSANPETDEILYTGAPDYTIQGISEGNWSGNVDDVGILLDTEGQTEGQQGSVSAGFPGIGNADTITYGIVTRIGGGTIFESGKLGNSTASIPHQPLYVGTA